VLQYHSDDTYATPATEAKANEYGIRGFPSMYFDGGNVVMGGSDSSYDQQTAVINRELAKTPPVAIVSTMVTSGSLKVSATITNTSNSSIFNSKLYVVIFEDLGTSEHHFTVRDIATPVTVTGLLPGTSQQFTVNSSYSESKNAIKAVVYLKASNGEILQAALGGVS
jgi:hypothetical protein